ncbi:MAG: PH domain-containing protein [Bacteroidales bacterium]
MKIVLQPNENILRAGSSNLRQDSRQVNGKLIVTNQRIYFKTLKPEYQLFNKEIEPGEISELFYYNVMWILPRGIMIKTKGGEELYFTVNQRDQWSKLITGMF